MVPGGQREETVALNAVIVGKASERGRGGLSQAYRERPLRTLSPVAAAQGTHENIRMPLDEHLGAIIGFP